MKLAETTQAQRLEALACYNNLREGYVLVLVTGKGTITELINSKTLGDSQVEDVTILRGAISILLEDTFYHHLVVPEGKKYIVVENTIYMLLDLTIHRAG